MSLCILNLILFIILLVGFIVTNKSTNNMLDNDMAIILNLINKYEKQQNQIDHILKYLDIKNTDGKEEIK